MELADVPDHTPPDTGQRSIEVTTRRRSYRSWGWDGLIGWEPRVMTLTVSVGSILNHSLGRTGVSAIARDSSKWRVGLGGWMRLSWENFQVVAGWLGGCPCDTNSQRHRIPHTPYTAECHGTVYHTTGVIQNSDNFVTDHWLPLLTSDPVDLDSVQTVTGRSVKPWTATSSVRLSTPVARDPLI